MRWILVLVCLFSAPLPSSAESRANPDGRPGTTWIEFGGGWSLSGTSEVRNNNPRPVGFDQISETKYRERAVAGQFGVVVDRRTTLILGLARSSARSEDAVPFFLDGRKIGDADAISSATVFSARVRLYLSGGG